MPDAHPRELEPALDAYASQHFLLICDLGRSLPGTGEDHTAPSIAKNVRINVQHFFTEGSAGIIRIRQNKHLNRRAIGPLQNTHFASTVPPKLLADLPVFSDR